MQHRILQPDDAEAYQALRLRGLAEVPLAFCADTDAEQARSLAVVIERIAPTDRRHVHGVFDGEVLVGIAGLMRERSSKLAHKAHLWGVYVAPEARGQGVGRLLIRSALDAARAMPGVRQVTLGVSVTTEPAIKLYEAMGFEVWGREPACLQWEGKLYDELHMVRVLRAD